MKADFMILGAQKCGTTTLYSLLDSHPGIVSSVPKEPHFFSLNEDWRSELDGYHRRFEQREGSIYFEGSTSYTFYPLRRMEIWNDLYEYNPRLKFIYIVRDPRDRIVSNYMHMFERGFTDKPLVEAIIQDRFYIDVSRYATQIRPFIERFGRERVHIAFFDDLRERPTQLVQELAEFLGVDPDGFVEVASVHANRSGQERRPIARFETRRWRLLRRVAPRIWRRFVHRSDRRFARRPELLPVQERMILRLLEPELRELEQMTSRDLSGWRGGA